ncbi:hypothetical protein OVA24_17405 [Luteolibacter sp. SL250]|uniref:hypothetical protein n=1 Tax=Luteolibacter sp. SL250 TaxID=2995170 RepID=UPI00226F6715|nr:hypothetical protein [Luteolibacter sp. SL250]WAC19009.1 hypothetical protein OVA24_17405 [Luteolibacter sp. SL250]
MKPLSRNLLFLALLCGGILAGRAIPSSGAAHASTAGTSEETHASRPDRPTAPEMRRTLATLHARVKAGETGPADLARALARVKTDTLKSIVLEQYDILAAMTEGGKARQPHQDLHTAAMEELWAREKSSALAWAETLEEPKARAMMQKSLLRRALEEDVEAALPWMAKYHAENGKAGTYDEFKTIAMKGAVSRGADAVIRAHAAFPDAGGYHALRDTIFPEDFDFAKLNEALGAKVEMTNVLTRWALRDRDAAWTAMEQRMAAMRGNPEREIGDGLMKAVLVRDGEDAGVAWMMDRLSAISDRDAMRHERILAGIIVNSNLSTDGIRVISGKLTPETRVRNAKSALLSRPSHASTGAFLAALPREDLIRTLQEVRQMTRGGSTTGAAQRERSFADMGRRFHLTSAEMETINGETAAQ